MKYVSTRGTAPALGFADVLLAGLAPDGGLYVPESWPALPPLASLRGRPYAEVAVEVMWPYVEGDIDRLVFEAMVADAYSSFARPEVCPVVPLGGGLHLLELYWGPTLAFKDVALQLVGRLFDQVLTERGRRATILGATSGDTGSAAMDACRGLEHLDAVILFPDGRVSDVQRRQMTTVSETNCHAVAVAGTFDDCQDLVKAAFADAEFRDEVDLSAVNSINWARVMAQVVYYVTAHLEVADDDEPVTYCVPTGNFGNILAGWVAKQAGLPVDRLVVASNRNDILTRFFASGTLEMHEVMPTTSPSMDIQVSSNLERLLFEVLDRDGARVSDLLGAFRADGVASVPTSALEALRSEFDAGRLDDEEAGGVIRRVHDRTGLILDPHTAVGVGVAERLDGAAGVPVVCLGTAHPAKFPDAVEAAIGVRPPLPDHLADLFDRPERIEHIAADLADVEALVRRAIATD
ncbi:MAG TPA: threonine synthase [Microthrixaceae bacterium]|nr:threonine synthase [Microthrixaceae bacterium]